MDPISIILDNITTKLCDMDKIRIVISYLMDQVGTNRAKQTLTELQFLLLLSTVFNSDTNIIDNLVNQPVVKSQKNCLFLVYSP